MEFLNGIAATADKWGWIGSALILGLVSWIGWTARKTFVTQEQHGAFKSKIESELSDQAGKISSVEKDLERRPTFKDLQELQSQIADTAAAVREGNAVMQGTKAVMQEQSKKLDIIIEHALRNGN